MMWIDKALTVVILLVGSGNTSGSVNLETPAVGTAIQASELTQRLQSNPPRSPGASVMVRCVGANGVFDFGPGTDDLVVVAPTIRQLDFNFVFAITNEMAITPPVGQHCRFFREPFPGGT